MRLRRASSRATTARLVPGVVSRAWPLRWSNLEQTVQSSVNAIDGRAGSVRLAVWPAACPTTSWDPGDTDTQLYRPVVASPSTVNVQGNPTITRPAVDAKK